MHGVTCGAGAAAYRAVRCSLLTVNFLSGILIILIFRDLGADWHDSLDLNNTVSPGHIPGHAPHSQSACCQSAGVRWQLVAVCIPRSLWGRAVGAVPHASGPSWPLHLQIVCTVCGF